MSLQVIQIGLEQLKYFKKIKCSKKPIELEWEIKLYKWILDQPDAEQKASDYVRVRMSTEGEPIPKRAVVAKLGWVIE